MVGNYDPGMPRIRVALVSLALVLVAGCGGGGTPKAGPGPSSTPPSSSPTASSSSTATTDPTAKPTLEARVPHSWRTVTAKKSGLRFGLPATWTKLDATKLNDPALRSRMDQFARGMGITRDQLKQVFAQIDLMAISATFTKDAYAEVEVVPVPMLGELPTRAALRSEFRVLKSIQVLGFRDVATPVGKGLVATLRKNIPGRGTVYSDGVFVLLDSGVVNVTVTAASQQQARTLVDTMVRSFVDVGRGGAVGNGSSVEG